MTFLCRRASRKTEKGAAAVEAAFVIGFILVPLMGIVFLFGKFSWHYMTIQKALHDATLYMASAPLIELKSGAAEAVAKEIMARETAQLDTTTRADVYFTCGFKISPDSTFMSYVSCGGDGDIGAVQATAFVKIQNPFFDPAIASGGLRFTIPVTMHYAAR